LKVDALAQVLWFGRNHTAARLATYSGAKIKAEETPTSPGYVSWLRRLVNEEITEKGEETEKGATARKNRDSAAAKLAVAKPDAVVEVDYLKDMEGLADAEKLRALLVLQANLAADIELTERKLRKSVKGQKAIKEARTAVTAARRRAVA
jgi:hypothetical protein